MLTIFVNLKGAWFLCLKVMILLSTKILVVVYLTIHDELTSAALKKNIYTSSNNVPCHPNREIITAVHLNSFFGLYHLHGGVHKFFHSI